MRTLAALIGIALAGPAPVAAQVQCILTGNPLQLRTEGLAEPLGETVVRCSGGAPFAPWNGSVQAFTSTQLANRTAGEFLEEVTLWQSSAGVWQPRTDLRARHVGPNSFVFENVAAAFDAGGQLAWRLTGVRAESAPQVQIFLSLQGNPQLLVPTPSVIAGRGLGVSLGAASQAAPAIPAPAPPEGIDFAGLMASGAPFVTTRFTEAAPDVFRPRSTLFETGSRILIRFGNVPAGSLVFAPAAIAGSNALQPTGAGNLGVAAAGGQWAAQGAGSLLLSLVTGARPDGSGGALAFQPKPGLNVLTQALPLDSHAGQPYAVYEVLDAAPAALESAQFPAWIFAPGGCCGSGVNVVDSHVSLGPVSSVRGLSDAAPLPRFGENAAAADCAWLDDCTAAYFPRLLVTPLSGTDFAAPAGAGPQYGFVSVRNDGGGLLRWRVRAATDDGGNWLKASPEAGVERATVRYDLLAAALEPGVYTGSVTVLAVGSPGEFKIPVRFTVTAPLPPPEPPPVVRDVVKAGNRLPGPVAPGSLALVLGEHFGAGPSVTAGGLPAKVLAAADNELLILIPPALDWTLGRAPVVVDRAGRRSAPWGVELAPLAPAILFAWNEDSDERNGPGAPVTAGKILRLYVTGLDRALGRVTVRLHDRDNLELLDPSGVEPLEGAVILRFQVPEDLPAMSTSVLVCGRTENGAAPRCAEPLDVWLSAQP